MRRSLLLDRLDGAPYSLPRALDRISERWWAMPPRRRSIAVAAVVLLIALVGVGHVSASPYGPPATVLVAAHDLTVGQELDPRDARRASWPEGLIPDGAVPEAVGRLAAPLPAGAVLTDRHLAGGGIADLLPDGTVAVPVPTDAVPTLHAGYRIDLIGRDLDGQAAILAREAHVLSSDDADVWLAVAHDDAPAVAAAAAGGAVTVVVLP